MIARPQKAGFPETMHAVVNIALKAARDAAEVLAHNSDRLDRVRVVEESGGQVITNMDLDAEKTVSPASPRAATRRTYGSSIRCVAAPIIVAASRTSACRWH